MKKLLLIWLFVAGVYFFSWAAVNLLGVNNLAIQSEDTVPALFIPFAIFKDKTLYLDNYYQFMRNAYPNPDDKSFVNNLVPFYLRKVDNHYLSAFPIITPLIVLPIFYIAVLLNIAISWQNLAVLAHLGGACIVGLSAALFYKLLEYNGLKNNKLLILTAIYSFGTINYALVSQGLWQHGTVQLFTIAALIFYTKFKQNLSYVNLAWMSFFFSIAVLARPTAGLPAIIFAVSLLINRDFIKRAGYMLLGIILPFAFFVWYNAAFYVSLSNQGYANQLFRNWLGDFPFSFFGVWLSPSKGILIYSPVIFFSFFGVNKALKINSTSKSLILLSALTVLLHTLVISFWKHWFGGWSFGYRMSSDVIPFMIIPLLAWIDSANVTLYTWKLFLAAIIFSIFVQIMGMFFYDGVWHAAYDRGFKDTTWLWSLKDSEAAFNIRRVFVKLGYLDKACPTCNVR